MTEAPLPAPPHRMESTVGEVPLGLGNGPGVVPEPRPGPTLRPIRAQIGPQRYILPVQGMDARFPENRTIDHNVPRRTSPPSEMHSAHYERHATTLQRRYLHKHHGELRLKR